MTRVFLKAKLNEKGQSLKFIYTTDTTFTKTKKMMALQKQNKSQRRPALCLKPASNIRKENLNQA